MEHDERRSGAIAPAWMLAFAGWLGASTELASRREEADPAAVEARIPDAARAAGGPRALDEFSSRELRALPGIGTTRALAIVRARWDEGLRGAPDAWDAVRGIGAETLRAIRDARRAEEASRRRL